MSTFRIFILVTHPVCFCSVEEARLRAEQEERERLERERKEKELAALEKKVNISQRHFTLCKPKIVQ